MNTGTAVKEASQSHQSKVCSKIFTTKDDSNALLVAQEGMLLLIEVPTNLAWPVSSIRAHSIDFHVRNILAVRQTIASIDSPLTH